jgi:hypothetical protein
MTTRKSEKKWTFERKKNNPKERNLKKPDGHLSEKKKTFERNVMY